VISPEFNVDVAFDKENLYNTLLLFEGEGGSVKANLYERYKLEFADTFFLLASNKLAEMAYLRTYD
jgi:hypothetical protein